LLTAGACSSVFAQETPSDSANAVASQVTAEQKTSTIQAELLRNTAF